MNRVDLCGAPPRKLTSNWRETLFERVGKRRESARAREALKNFRPLSPPKVKP